MSDPERAANRFYEDPNVAEVVLFSTMALNRSALDAFNQFGADSRTEGVPAVLLLDEAHPEWKSEAETAEHRAILTMPLKLRRLRQILANLIAQKA
jgi:serine/threonine-protein kinase